MIDTRDVIEFFDRLAPTWDAGMVRNEPVIARIFPSRKSSARTCPASSNPAAASPWPTA